MLAQILFLLFSVSVPHQNAVATKNGPATPYNDPDAYEIYAAVLPSEWPVREANATEPVINGTTTTYKMCLSPEPESRDLIGPAISDYVAQNEKNWQLQDKIKLDRPYRVVDSDQLIGSFSEQRWEDFYRQYPGSGGWMELSAVGFNANRTVAVVYMGHHCGLICGGGEFHVLEKKDGRWVPLKWKGGSCSWRS